MKTTSTTPLYRSFRAVTCAVAATIGAAAFAASASSANDTNTTAGNATLSTADHADHMDHKADHKDHNANTSSLKHADRRFVEKAAESGREEVEISQVAVERATNADVKHLAQMMVDDHTKANQELMSIAAAKGVTLKEDKDKNSNKWSKKDAKDFDRDYVKKMIADHKEAIDLFSNESKNGSDPELVEFARTTLPKLEQHLAHTDELKNLVK